LLHSFQYNIVETYRRVKARVVAIKKISSSVQAAAAPAPSRMPTEGGHAAGAGATGAHAPFKQPHFAEEVADWLKHRATPAEAQRFDR
jgi:hypothetical protein